MSGARVAAVLSFVALVPCCGTTRPGPSATDRDEWLLQLSYSAHLSEEFVGVWIARDGSVYDLGTRRTARDEGSLRHAGSLQATDLDSILTHIPTTPGIYGGTYDGPALRLHYRSRGGSWVFVVMDGILPDAVESLTDMVNQHVDAALRERLGRLRKDLAARDGNMPRRVRSLVGVAATPFSEGDGLPVYFRFKERSISGHGNR